jgi:serine/threonine protein kinase
MTPANRPDDSLPPTQDCPTAGTVGGGTQPDSSSSSVPGSTAAPGSSAAESAIVPGFQVLSVLGRGGMGVVYQARQEDLNRLVALKMILAAGHAGPMEVARFRKEAEAVARLHHPNFVQIYATGEAAGQPYLALEFVDGGSLADPSYAGPWSYRKAARLVETLARAMDYAHRRDLVHRDLKPANILLTADGTPKITDFGLVKQLDIVGGQTPSDAVLGTPSYMAPEQALGQSKRVGPAADIYALGAILYELLTGQPPFRAETPMQTIMQVTSAEPIPPRVLRPQVPAALETICLKCLRKEPEKRYGTARDLAADLRRFRERKRIEAKPLSRWEGALKWIRENPGGSILIVVVLLLFLLTLVQQLWTR